MAKSEFEVQAEKVFVGNTIDAVKVGEDNSLHIYTEGEVITIDKSALEKWYIQKVEERSIEDVLGGV